MCCSGQTIHADTPANATATTATTAPTRIVVGDAAEARAIDPAFFCIPLKNVVPHVCPTPFQSGTWPFNSRLSSSPDPPAYGIDCSNATKAERIAVVQGVQRTDEG